MEQNNLTRIDDKKFIFIQDLTDKEKYKLIILQLLKSRIIMKLFFIIFLPFLFVFILTMSSYSPSNLNSGLIKILPSLFFPALIVFVIFVMPLLTIRKQRGKMPVFEFDEWGMTVRNEDKTNNVAWQDLAFYSESVWFISLTQSKNKMLTYFIPKRAFKDNDEVREFIDFLIHQRLKRC